MFKIFLVLTDTNIRLNTAVGNKSLHVLLKKLESIVLLVCITVVFYV